MLHSRQQQQVLSKHKIASSLHLGKFAIRLILNVCMYSVCIWLNCVCFCSCVLIRRCKAVTLAGRSCPLGEMTGHTHTTVLLVTGAYPCVESPAGPGTSAIDWAKWPSSPSSALHPSGVCLHRLSSPHHPTSIHMQTPCSHRHTK